MAAKIMRLWLPVAAWAALIYFLSAQPSLATPFESVDFILRKLAHMAEYAALAWLLARALNGHALPGAKTYFWSFIAAAFYAMSDEYHQSFVPGRFCSPFDVLIDSAGIAAGLAVWRRIKSFSIFWARAASIPSSRSGQAR